jgi:hypothetical protein
MKIFLLKKILIITTYGLSLLYKIKIQIYKDSLRSITVSFATAFIILG